MVSARARQKSWSLISLGISHDLRRAQYWPLESDSGEMYGEYQIEAFIGASEH